MDDKTTLNAPLDLKAFITFRLNRLQASLNSQAQHILRTYCDIGQSEWRVLLLVVEHGESTMAQIVREGQMDKAQVSRAVKALVGKEYLASRTDPDDQRQSILTVTDSGGAVHKRVLPHMQARQRNLLAGLQDADIEQLYATLDRLEHAARARDF